MLYQKLYEHYRRQISNYTEDSVTLNTQHSYACYVIVYVQVSTKLCPQIIQREN